MKIEKIICDVCGEELTNSHPTRLEIQEYTREPNYRGYKKVKVYDICDKCKDRLPRLLRTQKEGE